VPDYSDCVCGRALVTDMLCWGPYQTAYGTVTGDLHSPPRQGNASLTSSITTLLNITDRPVFSFTVTFIRG